MSNEELKPDMRAETLELAGEFGSVFDDGTIEFDEDSLVRFVDVLRVEVARGALASKAAAVAVDEPDNRPTSAIDAVADFLEESANLSIISQFTSIAEWIDARASAVLVDFDAWATTQKWADRYDMDVARIGWTAALASRPPAPITSSPDAERDQEERETDQYVIKSLSEILAGVAVALKGPELPLHRHGYQDLVDIANALKLEVELYRANAVSPAPIASAEEAMEEIDAIVNDLGKCNCAANLDQCKSTVCLHQEAVVERSGWGWKLAPITREGRAGLTDAMMRAFYVAFEANSQRGDFERLSAGYNAMLEAIYPAAAQPSRAEVLEEVAQRLDAAAKDSYENWTPSKWDHRAFTHAAHLIRMLKDKP